MNPNDTHLRLHLKDRNPDDGMTAIAYDKGYFFLRLLEETVGRPAFDDFLKTYFTSHAFQVMDTDSFLGYLDANLLTTEALRAAVNVTAWVDGQGLPENCPEVQSARLDLVDATLDAWVRGDKRASDLPWDQWLYQEKYRFLSNLPDDISADRLAELDDAWSVNATGNNEVLFAWLEQAVRSHHTPAYERLETFLIHVGRRKFLTPLYKAMVETGQKAMADAIYEQARPNYHSVATGTMDELLGRSAN